jgi:hypothetical protein
MSIANGKVDILALGKVKFSNSNNMHSVRFSTLNYEVGCQLTYFILWLVSKVVFFSKNNKNPT